MATITLKGFELISAYEYAARKDVAVTNIYRLIKSGRILTTRIGKTNYINWNDYKKLKFPKSKQ